MNDRLTHYVPLHTKRKLLVVVLGLVTFSYGWTQLDAPLSLLLWGHRATAVATRVVKTKPGLSDQVLWDDLHLNAAEEKKDRSYIFWNEFQFRTEDGREQTFRMDIGSQLKPLYPLLDEDGLASTAQVYYDPKNPARLCVPGVLSTWFAPGLITFMGLVCTGYGCLMLFLSRRKIEIH